MGITKVFFFLPAVILLSIFLIYPLFQTIYLSFTSSNGQFIGINNYINILSRKEVLNLENFPIPPLGALIHNLLWTCIHLPLSIFLGLIFAVLLRNVKGGTIIKSIIFTGMVIPLIVGGLLIRFSFESGPGIVPAFFQILGIKSLSKNWIAYPDTALFALILGSVWLWTGFNLVIYSAALVGIPKEIEEASMVDGANPIQRFFYIILPLLKPVTLTTTMATFIFELKTFDIVYISTRGGPGDASMTLALLMYFYAFRGLDYNSAATVAVFLTLLTLIPAFLMIRQYIKT